jgi:DNA-directed RNA polymerase specialized sigma24 family protein
VKHNLDDISRSEIVKAIDEWILNERDREMLKRRLVDGKTYEALSYEFDLSVRHTKTIIYKAEEKLFTKIAHN